MNKTNPIALSLLLVGLVACGDTETEKDIVEPNFSKSDSLRSVQQRGELRFGDEITGKFEADAAFHGYRFNSLPIGEFTVEVTQRGSSRDLDTTLFVFGSENGTSWKRIGFDDDSGWGALSKLSNVSASDFTNFMVVVGTADGTGRGDYRVTLECTNDKCGSNSLPNDNGCSDEIYAIFDQCVQDQLENADWGFDDPAEEWSIEYCVNDGGVLEAQEYQCLGIQPEPPAYCDGGSERVRNAIPACTERLKQEYYIIDRVALERLQISETLQTAFDEYTESQPYWAWASAEAYTTPSGATTREVAATIRSFNDRASALSGKSEPVDRDTFRANDYLPVEVLDAIEAEYGTNYLAVEFSGSYYVAAGAEEWVTVFALHFPEANVAFGLTEAAGED